MERYILSGLQMLLNRQWENHQALVIEQGKIQAIIPENMIQHHLPAKHLTFPADHYLTPGLIDLHVHGAAGSDVMDGTFDALQQISKALAKEGVTGFLATTMTAPNQKIEQVLATIAEYDNAEGAALLGVHLEGPFLAAKKKGAQADFLQPPDIALFKKWQEIAQNKIKIVTLAPELKDALAFIQALTQMHVIISIGHTNATYAEAMAAIAAGCSQATHVFNAMRELHQREPGVACAVLLSDTVSVELIADGFHLHAAIVDLIYRLKHKDRILLITDAMRAKCLKDGSYELGGQTVTVKSNCATLADGTLAGSTLRLPQAIHHMHEFTQCSLIDAIQMATENPARVLGLYQNKGSIEVGKDADLTIFDSHLNTMLTMRAGEKIFSV